MNTRPQRPHTVIGTEGPDDLQAYEPAGGRVEGLEGDDTINGSDFNDRLFGGPGTNIVYGRGGDDKLIGVYGEAYGGDGDDKIVDTSFADGGAGHDWIDSRSGNDTVLGGDGDDLILARRGNDLVRGGAGDDYIDGGDGSNTLVGGSGDDVIQTGRGWSILAGQDGNDTLYGNRFSATLLGGNGYDVLIGGSKGDSISGGDGSDHIFGATGRDTLLGGEGYDTLDGGPGHDIATGGVGRDVFVINDDGGALVITDFEQGVDSLYLDGLDYDDLTFRGRVILDAQGDVVAAFSDGFEAASLREEWDFSHDIADF